MTSQLKKKPQIHQARKMYQIVNLRKLLGIGCMFSLAAVDTALRLLRQS